MSRSQNPSKPWVYVPETEGDYMPSDDQGWS